VGQDPLDLPPGQMLLRSSPESAEQYSASPETYDGGHQLGSGETVWLNLPVG
jgi:alpha-glucosidase